MNWFLMGVAFFLLALAALFLATTGGSRVPGLIGISLMCFGFGEILAAIKERK